MLAMMSSLGCEACRLTRGDGEDVANMVEALKPYVVFLDFDRTLATTKGGGSPLQGSHTVDVDLASMIAGQWHLSPPPLPPAHHPVFPIIREILRRNRARAIEHAQYNRSNRTGVVEHKQ